MNRAAATKKDLCQPNSDDEFDRYREREAELQEDESTQSVSQKPAPSQRCSQKVRYDSQKIKDILHSQKDILNRLDKNDRMLQEVLTTVKEIKNIIPMISSGVGGPLQRHDIFSPLNMPN